MDREEDIDIVDSNNNNQDKQNIEDDNFYTSQIIEENLKKSKKMVNDTDITNEERSRKQAKLEYTYQQIITLQAEQVNGKANLHGTNTKLAENMRNSSNVIDFDKILNSNVI